MMRDRSKNCTILIKRNELSPFEHLKISLLFSGWASIGDRYLVLKTRYASNEGIDEEPKKGGLGMRLFMI